MRALVLCSLLVAGLAAAAERPRVAVLEVNVRGEASPALRAQLEKSLDGGLYSAGFEVVPAREVAGKLRKAKSLAGCTSTTCLARIGELVGATRFVRAKIDADGGAYDLELELLAADAEAGLVRRVEKTCSACTVRDVNDLVSRSVVELMAPAAPEAPRAVKVAVTSRPEGASVSVDGSLLGRAPVEVELEPGEHLFEASLAGHAAASRRESVAGESAQVQLELAASGPAPVVDAPPRSRFGVWKWAAVGGGVAAIGAGVALIALDGKKTDCAAGQPCKNELHTLPGGLALTGVGLGLGALATWMFLTDTPVVMVPADKGGVAFLVGGRF